VTRLPGGSKKDSPPERLVDEGTIHFGSWLGSPGKANLIDARRPYRFPVPPAFQRLRLKEWRAVQAGDEDFFLCAVLYDAKFMSMASLDVWDRKKGRSYGFRKIFPGSRFSLPLDLEPGSTKAETADCRASIELGPEPGALRLDFSYRPRGGSAIELNLDFGVAAPEAYPFSVCLPLGPNRAMYSTKVVSPCSGSLILGSSVHAFDRSTSLAVLDDHKGYYPYRLHYDWVTGFGYAPGRAAAQRGSGGSPLGFNLTDNQVADQARFNENRLWLEGEILPLPPVKFDRPSGRSGPWIIRDADIAPSIAASAASSTNAAAASASAAAASPGFVNLVFHPEVDHDIAVKLGIAEIDYAGPFGRFEGWLKAPDGRIVRTEDLYGMGEDKRVRL